MYYYTHYYLGHMWYLLLIYIDILRRRSLIHFAASKKLSVSINSRSENVLVGLQLPGMPSHMHICVYRYCIHRLLCNATINIWTLKRSITFVIIRWSYVCICTIDSMFEIPWYFKLKFVDVRIRQYSCIYIQCLIYLMYFLINNNNLFEMVRK